MSDRLHCLTKKVKTPMGSVFVHADIDDGGRVHEFRISQAQKFEDTAVGKLLDEIARAANEIFSEAR